MPHLDDEAIYTRAAAGESDDHLRSCETCRARWERAVALRRAVRAAPRTIDPPTDLWPSIKASIAARPHVSAAPHRRTWRLAASIVIAVALATTVLVTVRRRIPQSSDVRAVPIPSFPAVRAVTDSAAAANDARVERELLSELELRRGELRPETAAQIQANLRTIDAAIADVRAALVRDPDNAALRQMLVDAYERKVDLVTLIANAS
jgi:hypothetical protein